MDKSGIHEGVWGVIVVSLLMLIAHLGLSAFNYWGKRIKIKHNNEVAGIIFGVLTLIYSLNVAFIIVAVWENYEKLNHVIEREVEDLNSFVVHSNMLPDSLKHCAWDAIKSYCLKVVNEEWGVSEDQVVLEQSAIPSLRLLLFRAEADSEIHQSVVTVLDDNLSNVTKAHRERLSHTRAYVPKPVWTILNIGSILVICFSYFLHLESALLKRIFLSFLWAMMAMSLFLIYMLDHPFEGRNQVSKEPYETIIHMLPKQRFLY